MSLINPSYFVGEINIPNTNEEDVQARLALFINKYEERFLTDLLGYELYKEFMAGLSINPVPARWSSLLFGTNYTYYNRTAPWKGLIQMPVGVTATIDNSNILEMTVGGAGQYDPVADSTSVAVPASYVGVPVVLERTGIGQMPSSHYSIAANVLTLTNGTVFNDSETFFLKKNITIGITPLSNALPSSPIANYVYYWWQKDIVTSTTQSGEKRNKSENSTDASSAYKMVKAWNEMVNQVWSLVGFLDANATDYVEWSWYRNTTGSYWMNYNHARLKDIFYPINSLGI